MQLDLGQLAPMLGIGLLLLLVVGTLVFILYCWFQAGTLAVLLAGEAQAPSSRQAPAAVFRTFSWSGFVGWASRYALRIFWVNNLFLLFPHPAAPRRSACRFWLMAASLPRNELSAAACVIGCGLALPIGFVALVLVLAMIVAQICAVEEGATILGSTRRAFSITGSRLGGLLLLYLLLALGSIAVATFFGGLGLIVKLALARAAMLQSVLSFLLGAVEFVASTTLTLAMTAAIVALVRAELRLRPAAPRPDA